MTTNEVAVFETGTIIPAVPAGQSRAQQLAELRAEAEFLTVAYELAQRACGTQLVAAHFRGKPEDGAIAIAYGSSLGWHWTKALQDVYVVKGKPAIMAKEMRELVIRAGHSIWEEQVGPELVVLAGHRNGSDIVYRSEWTIARAKTAGFYDSNPNYKTSPENMLYARATTELCRRMAPDALSGLGYSAEEMRDQELVEVAGGPRVARPSAHRGTATRGVAGVREKLGLQAAPRPEPEAAVPAAPPVETPAAQAAAPASNSQLQKVAILLKEVEGLTEAGDKLAWLAEQFKRPFTSSKELTKDKTTELLVWLERQRAADAQAAG